MKEQSVFLDYKDAKVHFLRFGEGEKLLIALHGFGDRAAMFVHLETALLPHYTVYALDLPYHGHTEWPEDSFSSADLHSLIQMVMKREGKERLSLMGFSFGGRLVQKLFPPLQRQVDQVFLMAPDGIQTRWMFNLVMLPRHLRLFLRFLLRNPKWFIAMIGSFYRWGICSKFIHDFAYNHIYTKARRDRIFCTWLSLNDFILHPKKVKAIFRQSEIPIYLYFGKRDEVIPVSAGTWMQEGLPNAHLRVLEEGHLLIGPELNGILEKQLGGKS